MQKKLMGVFKHPPPPVGRGLNSLSYGFRVFLCTSHSQAACLGHDTIVQTVMGMARDMKDEPDSDGYTPVFYAATGKQDEIYDMLAKAGADIHRVDKVSSQVKARQAQCQGHNYNVQTFAGVETRFIESGIKYHLILLLYMCWRFWKKYTNELCFHSALFYKNSEKEQKIQLQQLMGSCWYLS